MLTSSPSSTRPPDDAELADLFPELKIGRLLGQGGSGLVYEARQKSLDRRVALKLLGAGSVAADRRQLFECEIQALARLNHPNIVAMFDVGERGDWMYLLMELIDGPTLAQRLKEGAMNSAEALAVAEQVCDALAHAHAAGVVHRDIKPANVLLDRQGRAKLADFGGAKILQEAQSLEAAAMPGTPHYMPPEQRRRSGTVDARTDLYSLGVVLYEMLTGKLPEGRFAMPSCTAGTGTALDATVMQAMATEPEARFQSAHAMSAALTLAATSLPTRRRKLPAKLAWPLTILTLLGIAAGIVTSRKQAPLAQSAAAHSISRETRPHRPEAPPSEDRPPTRAGRTELHLAVARGDLQALAKLLQDKGEADSPDEGGWTPMLMAVADDRADLAELLRLAGAKSDAGLPGKISAMHVAAGRGALQAARWLKSHAAATDSRDEAGWRPIDWAAACLQPEMVRWLVQQGVPLKSAEGEREPPMGLTPLHLAAGAGQPPKGASAKPPWQIVWRGGSTRPERCVDTLQLLLQKGSSINDRDRDNLSALHHAAAANQAAAVTFLVDQGTDVNAMPPPEALTPMAMAAERNATAAMAALFAKGAKSQMPVGLEAPLHKAARNGHLEAAELLLAHDPNPNLRDMSLATPLHRAAAGGHPGTIKLLLARGAQLEARDNHLRTPLHHAAAAGMLEATRLLCETGAQATSRDLTGLTPADLAASCGFTGVAILLASYADKQKAGMSK